MKILDPNTKFAKLGKPGSLFSMGFKRRLDIIQKFVDLKNKKILDLGCGEGVWLNEFTKFTKKEMVFGSDYDEQQIKQIVEQNKVNIPKENLKICPAESLFFENDFFDIIFQNEVLEHVNDDQKTLNECFRVLKKGGILVFFTPNRLWPFEQHGMYLGKRYIWGNIPFLPWLPKVLYKRFAPHVRNYSTSELKKMLRQSGFIIEKNTFVFPGFDGAVRKFRFIGKVIQKKFHFLENTPFRIFGISHLFIAKKP